MSEPQVGKPLIAARLAARGSRAAGPSQSPGWSPAQRPGMHAPASPSSRRGRSRPRRGGSTSMHRLREEQRVDGSGSVGSTALEVDLVAAVALDAVDRRARRSLRSRAWYSRTTSGRRRSSVRLSIGAELARRAGSRSRTSTFGETQSMKRTPRRVHLPDQPGGVGECACGRTRACRCTSPTGCRRAPSRAGSRPPGSA